MHHLTYVTLGARDLGALRAFYQRWGWPEREGSSDSFATYEAGGVILALYPIELLGEEAAPGEGVPAAGWNGITLGMNVARDEGDAEFDRAVAAGATEVARPVERAWGGYTGYVADPEGNRWEIAWAPD
jgi:catechol 2,3-dioxygenase-like lactoylglutathione lyase family enzyme